MLEFESDDDSEDWIVLRAWPIQIYAEVMSAILHKVVFLAWKSLNYCTPYCISNKDGDERWTFTYKQLTLLIETLTLLHQKLPSINTQRDKHELLLK